MITIEQIIFQTNEKKSIFQISHGACCTNNFFNQNYHF